MRKCSREVSRTNLTGAAEAVHPELFESECIIHSHYQDCRRRDEQKYVGGEEFVAFSPPNDPGTALKSFPNLTGPLFGITVPTSIRTLKMP